MATFNTMAVTPLAAAATQIHFVRLAAVNPLAMTGTQIHAVWRTVQNDVAEVASTIIVASIPAERPPLQYAEGFTDGEIYGFSSQQEEIMEPIQLGETDDDKKTISFLVYSDAGFPASGLAGGAAVASPGVGDVQTNRDLAGYVNSTGTFSHVGDGLYRYTFSNAEVASGGGEGNIWLRAKISGYRTVAIRVPIRDIITANTARDAVLNAARSGFVGSGTVGEGISIAASLLQGNFYMDNVTNTVNGQTDARIRCFHTGAATTGATAGGSGEGEFATFIVETSYSGPNKIVTHRVVQQ